MKRILYLSCFFGSLAAARADELALSPEASVLERDISDPEYHRLLSRMEAHELADEWRRVVTVDDPKEFLRRHGGQRNVESDEQLRLAYERRRQIRERFLELIRSNLKRFNWDAPFDLGATAPVSATNIIAARDSPFSGKSRVELVGLPAESDNWPMFRGPGAQGRATSLLSASESLKDLRVEWKRPLGGGGNSSPVVWEDHLFVTTSSIDGYERSLLAIDRETGAVLWKRSVDVDELEPNTRETNGYASSTPVCDGSHVVVFWGNPGISCYTMEGDLRWNRRLGPIDATWGIGASPVLFEGSVIVSQDQDKAPSIFVSLDLAAGKVRWTGDRPQATGWATPVLVTISGTTQLVTHGQGHVYGYDPHSGEELWKIEGGAIEAISPLIVGEDYLYSATGRLGPLLAIVPPVLGHPPIVAWEVVRGGPFVPAPVLRDNRLYLVSDMGVASCYDARTGELKWTNRLGGRFFASPIVTPEHVIFVSEDGDVFVVKCSDTYELVVRHSLHESVLASPVMSRGKVYIRGHEYLYAMSPE